MKQVLSEEAKEFCWVALSLLFFPHLQVSPVLSNEHCKTSVPLSWCGVGVCSPVPALEWFAEDAPSCSVRSEAGGVSSPLLFSGGVQGGHWAALHPAGGNGSSLQLVSTECLGAGCVLECSQPPPECLPVLCFVLQSCVLGPCTQTRIQRKGSCVSFESCS